MANYWIKLYIEILDDPKMATLPDRLWRRVVEMFLLAGRQNKQGQLPDDREIAWSLRVPTEELELDMVQLINTGIVQRTGTGYLVTHFEIRQDAATPTERWKEHRDRKRKDEYYSNEDQTKIKRFVDRTESEGKQTESQTEQKQNVGGDQTIRLSDPSLLIIPMIARVSGMAYIPDTSKIEPLTRMIEVYGLEKTEKELKRQFDKWTGTKRKDNSGSYRPTNMGWVDWAQDELVGKPQSDPAELTGKELREWLLAHQPT